jgi:glycine/D-amino acid oxidase-like deaminating enzyme
MSTITATRTVRQLQPVTGSVKVLRPIGDVNDKAGEITIDGKAYYLTRPDNNFRLTGYDHRKQQVTTYDLPADLSSCDCPDATYRGERPGGCKHRKALAALKTAGKV